MLFKSMTVALLIFGPISGFAQTPKFQVAFNQKDSVIWSQELQKIDLSQVKDKNGTPFDMMQFTSNDDAFRVLCLRQVSNPKNAKCTMFTDASLSKANSTEFQEAYDGAVQKITFKNVTDVGRLNQLVNGYDKIYKTTETKSVNSDGPPLRVPLLQADCTAAKTCEINLVVGSN